MQSYFYFLTCIYVSVSHFLKIDNLIIYIYIIITLKFNREQGFILNILSEFIVGLLFDQIQLGYSWVDVKAKWNIKRKSVLSSSAIR
jgi:hypothetical protein